MGDTSEPGFESAVVNLDDFHHQTQKQNSYLSLSLTRTKMFNAPDRSPTKMFGSLPCFHWLSEFFCLRTRIASTASKTSSEYESRKDVSEEPSRVLCFERAAEVSVFIPPPER